MEWILARSAASEPVTRSECMSFVHAIASLHDRSVQPPERHWFDRFWQRHPRIDYKIVQEKESRRTTRASWSSGSRHTVRR